MKIILLAFCFLCLSAMRVRSKPQITRLYPIQEMIEREQTNTETKPLDKLLGKLRATYNFVFRKPENTSNVEKILAKDAPDPDVQTLKSIWLNRMEQYRRINQDAEKSREPERTYLSDDDWVNDIQPLDRLEPLEFDEEDMEDKNRDVEFVTPRNGFQLPVTLSRHLVEWLGSLLGITYGVYSKLARVIYTNNTVTNN
ncbi:uncharacterized protein LOC114873738 [Osmia bicornis bicornis]|uniref:uncharacterized protein LOC114873738 n=1 Tax=Osmia bicornis bicornis TaxID=1437191 RepID=UPI0010F9C006|nr:uncharacterized protein LOC114873738 [Osmia bicornis bicornis]